MGSLFAFLILVSMAGVITAIVGIKNQIQKSKQRKRDIEEFERQHPSSDIVNSNQ